MMPPFEESGGVVTFDVSTAACSKCEENILLKPDVSHLMTLGDWGRYVTARLHGLIRALPHEHHRDLMVLTAAATSLGVAIEVEGRIPSSFCSIVD